MTDTLFDLDIEAPVVVPTHAHTGYDCAFCATRTGPEAKQVATAAVTRDLAWWGEANNWLNCQEPGSTFTADDLVSCIGKPTGSSNQIGARLRSWAMSDLITAVGIREAGRPESHGRILRVWQVTAWT